MATEICPSMKIHLLRSEELSTDRFRAVVELVRQFPGPVQYIAREEDIAWEEDELWEEEWDQERINTKVLYSRSAPMLEDKTIYVSHWPAIFEKCDDYRKRKRIPNEEAIVLLTDHANEYNWFSSWEPSGKRNFFIHTELWDRFIASDPVYPVAYELASIPLILAMFESQPQFVEYAHRQPRGCVMDLCADKRDIRLKLRTGDLCDECRTRLISCNPDPGLVRQVFAILDGIRKPMMFLERFTVTRQPSSIVADMRRREIRFIDLGGRVLRLNPMEITVYRFFMNHPEGVAFPFIPDFRTEIRRIYGMASNASLIATLDNRTDALVTNRDELLSQVFSRINRKIRSFVGYEMAEHYIIQGERGEARKILVDRGLVRIED